MGLNILAHYESLQTSVLYKKNSGKSLLSIVQKTLKHQLKEHGSTSSRLTLQATERGLRTLDVELGGQE